MNKPIELTWQLASERLPEIAKGDQCSVEVLAGCWITDHWLRDDHPNKKRFIFGSCSVIREKDVRNFPQGKRWLTFGPSHNDITHWAYVSPPHCGNKGDDQ